MHANKERLIRIGNAILSASRNELYLSMRFLDLALSGLGYEMNLNTATIGTDGVHILYNPTYLKRQYLEDLVELNRTYLHMVLHCMFRHEINRQDRDPVLWDMACDIAVESILDTIEAKSVAMVVPLFREETYDRLRESLSVLTAEGIYRVLDGQEIPFDQQIHYHKYFHRDDHQFWMQQQEQNQSGPSSNGGNNHRQRELSDKWRDISDKTRTSMETFYAEHGTEAGTLLQAIQIENRERYDYRRFLQQFLTLREEVQVDPDSFDYGFYSYGLKLYGNIPLMEPLEYRDSRKIHDLVIVIDTSDSCSEGVIQAFLAETRAILNQESLFFQEMNLHIIQNDAGIQEDTVLRPPEEFRQFNRTFTVKGYGGTDFRPAFSYVNQLIETGQLTDLKGLLYFTDGFGTYPKHRPPYETAFLFFRDQYQDTNVPPWAMKVILGPDELTEVKAHEH